MRRPPRPALPLVEMVARWQASTGRTYARRARASPIARVLACWRWRVRP